MSEDRCYRCTKPAANARGTIYVREEIDGRWRNVAICTPCWEETRSGRTPVRALHEAGEPLLSGRSGLLSIDLAAIEAQANIATEGPWNVFWIVSSAGRSARIYVATPDGAKDIAHIALDWNASANAQFIADARENIPVLIARVQELESALGFYAEEDAYILHPNIMPPGHEAESLIDRDGGALARRTLGQP